MPIERLDHSINYLPPRDTGGSLYEQGIISSNGDQFTPTHEGKNDGNPVYVPDPDLEAKDPVGEFQKALSARRHEEAREILLRNLDAFDAKRLFNDARRVINGDLW